MKVLVFDTETTGLIPKKTSVFDTTKWPYVVQLSYILYDTESNSSILCKDYVIKNMYFESGSKVHAFI